MDGLKWYLKVGDDICGTQTWTIQDFRIFPKRDKKEIYKLKVFLMGRKLNVRRSFMDTLLFTKDQL